MLEIKNLSFCAPNGYQILKDFNHTFQKGITVVTGQNGSGKTTLSKLLIGAIKPTSGEILFNGTNITKLPINERANLGITIAFQQPIKFKGITVQRLLDIAGKEKTSVTEACSYLSKVGLCARDYIDRELNNTLSGGELKRIELAIALAKGGEVFIFDEPEAGIDIWSFDGLTNLFESLKDKTVIIVSHNKKIIDIADHVVLLNKNAPPKIGTKKELAKLIEEQTCKVQREGVWTI